MFILDAFLSYLISSTFKSSSFFGPFTLLFKSIHDFFALSYFVSLSKVSRFLEDVQIPIKGSFQFEWFNSDFPLHFIFHWVFFRGKILLHKGCSYALMSVLRVGDKVNMSSFWPWGRVRGLKIKCFDLVRSRMPMLIPTHFFFWPLKLILWTVLIGIMMPTSLNGLVGHVGPWIKRYEYSLEWGLWKWRCVFLFWIFGIWSLPIKEVTRWWLVNGFRIKQNRT